MSDRILISVRPCPSYEPGAVNEAVQAVLDDLGGFALIPAAGPVLIKPNLLMGEAPERAITTHPEVVKALAAAFKRRGAEVMAGDSPGLGTCRWAAERSGIAAAVREAGGAICPFNVQVTLGRGEGRRFPVAAEVARAGLLVNAPKLKTHGMMVLSGAVKNLFGCIVGLRKPAYHLECQGVEQFAALLLELAEAVAPGLTIMDAVVAMDGAGPRHGRARPAGLILGSRDPLALDFVVAELAGLNADDVPHLRLARKEGRIAADPDRRLVVGADPRAVRIQDFQSPPRARRMDFSLSAGLHGLLGKGLGMHPRVLAGCNACGACAQVCPARAIECAGGRARIDRAKCIKCYCCEEMCPAGMMRLRPGAINRLWPFG